MSRRFFKLTLIFGYLALFTILSSPFVSIIFASKSDSFRYGYSFVEINWGTVFLISLAFALVIVVWNAMEFEKHPNIDLAQYFKPRQKYDLISDKRITFDELNSEVESNVIRRGWKLDRKTDDQIRIRRMNYLMNDIVTLSLTDGKLQIESRPRFKILIVDMARNYRNVLDVSKRLKALR